MEMTIDDWRKQIDGIDVELLALLNKRAQVVCKIAQLKCEQNASICDPERERELVERLCGRNDGPLDERAISTIFRSIIDESRRTQGSLIDRWPTQVRD